MKLVKNYKPTKRKGIFENTRTGRYQARKQIGDKHFKESFDSLFDAVIWRESFDGEKSQVIKKNTSSLREVWKVMQQKHFPTLEDSTKDIWLRRYQLLDGIENFRMEDITSDIIDSWIQEKVKYFKSDEYMKGPRGLAKRCSLDNELNLFSTIFNWYKKSKDFKTEATNLSNPVYRSHYKMAFIQARPVKDKSITLEAALQFFSCLKPMYSDLALFQFYTASRIGEAAGLQWSRIDFENKRATIMETCIWDNKHKVFIKLKQYPKNREARPVYLTPELVAVLKRRLAFKVEGNDFVFHVEGRPLNYCNIQMNYRDAQRIAGIPYRGTHILRHGMAKLARKVGGGLDAVIAMTGHKDFKLADHYSKLDTEFQKEVSEKIMDHVNSFRIGADNVIPLPGISKTGSRP